MKKLLFLFTLLFVLTETMAQQNGSFIDTRDGQTYKTVNIGNQTWMAENLNYKTDSSFAYSDILELTQKYGRLYSWKNAITSCPDGWHLPTDDEWKKLEMFLGMDPKIVNISFWRGTFEGATLKDTTHWNDNSHAKDSLGFSMLPGGYRSITGKYDLIGDYGYCWTATELTDQMAWYRRFSGNKSQILRFTNNKQQGYSVRCLKD